LLASGLPNLYFKPGKPINLYGWLLAQLASENLENIPETSIEPAGPTFWSRLSEGMQDLIVIVFWLLLIFSVVYAIVSPKFRRELVRMFVFILFLMVLLPNIAKRLVQRPGSIEILRPQSGPSAGFRVVRYRGQAHALCHEILLYLHGQLWFGHHHLDGGH